MSTEQRPALSPLSAALHPTLLEGPLPGLWPALLRELTRGHPVTVADLANTTGRDPGELRSAVFQVITASVTSDRHRDCSVCWS